MLQVVDDKAYKRCHIKSIGERDEEQCVLVWRISDSFAPKRKEKKKTTALQFDGNIRFRIRSGAIGYLNLSKLKLLAFALKTRLLLPLLFFNVFVKISTPLTESYAYLGPQI